MNLFSTILLLYDTTKIESVRRNEEKIVRLKGTKTNVCFSSYSFISGWKKRINLALSLFLLTDQSYWIQLDNRTASLTCTFFEPSSFSVNEYVEVKKSWKVVYQWLWPFVLTLQPCQGFEYNFLFKWIPLSHGQKSFKRFTWIRDSMGDLIQDEEGKEIESKYGV